MSKQAIALTAEKIAAENWVDRYVRGRLTAEQQQAFEMYMLDKPALQDEIMLAQALKQGLAAQPASAFKAEKASGGWFQRLFPTSLQPVLATGGAALAAVFAVLLTLNQSEIDRLQADVAALEGPQTGIELAYLPQVRAVSSSEFEPVAVLNAVDKGWQLLQLELGFPEADRFDLRITSWGDSKALIALDDLQAAADDTLMFSVPAGQLPPGRYQATVTEHANTQTIATFQFSVENDGTG